MLGRAAEPRSPAGRWDINAIAVAELFPGMSERSAPGVEVAYFRPIHVSAHPATRSIAGTPEGTPDRMLLLQQTGYGRLRPGDLLVLAARHQHNIAQLLESLGLWTRLLNTIQVIQYQSTERSYLNDLKDLKIR